MTEYDSITDTKLHIANVEKFINQVIAELSYRAASHDISKLRSPEKEILDEATPKLKDLTYGSPEYKQNLNGSLMKPFLSHHYMVNRHHPEFFGDGVDGMDIVDIIEMFCDWKAATLRHTDGNILKSIGHNADRFDINHQLVKILFNTASRMGW